MLNRLLRGHADQHGLQSEAGLPELRQDVREGVEQVETPTAPDVQVGQALERPDYIPERVRNAGIQPDAAALGADLPTAGKLAGRHCLTLERNGDAETVHPEIERVDGPRRAAVGDAGVDAHPRRGNAAGQEDGFEQGGRFDPDSASLADAGAHGPTRAQRDGRRRRRCRPGRRGARLAEAGASLGGGSPASQSGSTSR